MNTAPLPPAPRPLPQWDFRDECVVLSGGARGIGAALVEAFAGHGAKVVFGDIDPAGADLVREGVHFVEADFTGPQAWARMREEVERLGLRANLVVANVGIGHHEALEETSLDDYERLLNGNLRSGWLAARDLGAHLRSKPGNSLILLGSVMASFGSPGHSLYTMTKAALSGLLRALCVEFSPAGVRANMVVPGYIINDPPPLFRAAIPPEHWRAFHARFGEEAAAANPPVQPFRWWGQPRDIAQAVCYLHSEAARYVTGTELRVDGGLLCQSPIRPESGNDAWAWTPAMVEWLRERGVTVSLS